MMNYREDILEIFDLMQLPDNNDFVKIGEQVLKHKDKFLTVYEKIKDAPISQMENAIERKQQFISEYHEKYKSAVERIGYTYVYFLERVVNAPTKIHMMGVTPIIFPIIIHFINEHEKESAIK